jgi:hypothetical protein
VLMPLFYIGWVRQSWNTVPAWNIVVSLSLFISLEVLTGYGAVYAFRSYITWAGSILKGGLNAERMESGSAGSHKAGC